jgi:hypothetical protein
MYKPSLKRSQLPTTPTHEKPPPRPFAKVPDHTQMAPTDSLMISSRLLDAPSSRSKDRKAVLAPLFAQSHPYPPRVAEMLAEEQ